MSWPVPFLGSESMIGEIVGSLKEPQPPRPLGPSKPTSIQERHSLHRFRLTFRVHQDPMPAVKPDGLVIRYAANAVKDFAPRRLKRWIQDAAKAYFDTTKAPHFNLDNFRATAMSKARLAGVSYDDAAVAFDGDPRVMQQHYAAFDKASVADRVFGQIQNGSNRGGTDGGAVGAQP